MNNALMFATGNDVTGTDPAFFAKLDDEFKFGRDVAALRSNCKVFARISNNGEFARDYPIYFGPDHELTAHRDCLTLDWPTDKPNWLNPPYSRGECYRFVKKAAEQQARGATTVMLLAARTDTAWWHEFVWDSAFRTFRRGVSVRFVKGRLKFEGHKDPAPFPSVVVIFEGF
jgi:hypothetical protein